jgi:hypothetical protein
MEIEKTPAFVDARKIIDNGMTSTNYGWKVKIDANGKEVRPLAVTLLSIDRDYLKMFADVTVLTVKMGLGDYARIIYPNRQALELTLNKYPLTENSGQTLKNQTVQYGIYTAVLLDNGRSPTVGQGAESNTIEALNISQIVEVSFQLIEKSVEKLRTVMVGTIGLSTNPERLLSSLITGAIGKLKLPTPQSVRGLEIYPPDNKDVRGQIPITQGTRLVDLPDFLQKRVGLYNSGVGTYIQNGFWHVYPVYDTSNFNHSKKTLTVYVLPKRKFSNIERTFMVTGDHCEVLATGETSFKDDNGSNYLNTGNGVRFADASKIMDGAMSISGNKVHVSRNNANFELKSDDIVGGINYASVSDRRITSNPFIELSRLAAKNGGEFVCVWENSDASILVPGMAVKIIYFDESKVKQIYGVLHSSKTISVHASGFKSERFINTTRLSIFANGQLKEIT